METPSYSHRDLNSANNPQGRGKSPGRREQAPRYSFTATRETKSPSTPTPS